MLSEVEYAAVIICRNADEVLKETRFIACDLLGAAAEGHLRSLWTCGDRVNRRR